MANANDEGDTINLEEGTYTLTEVNNEDESPFDAGANGLPVIAGRITINGADASNTIIARNDDSVPLLRIFQIAATGVLTLDGVTTTGGKVTSFAGGILNTGTLALINSIVSGNNSINITSSSGGLENVGGTVSLINSTVSGNTAGANAGGISNGSGTRSAKMLLINSTVSDNTAGEDGGGGGILNASGTGAPATLTLINSTVSGNTAGGDGGGINSLGPRSILRVTNSRITGNSSGDFGGGIRNREGSRLILIDSIISSNTAIDGGGINNIDSKATIRHSSIIANRAVDNGGGIFNNGTVIVRRSFIVANEAGNGGGIFNDNGMITLVRTRVAVNVPNDCIGCP